MCYESIEYNLKGTIVLVPGDNLASQFLGGYKALNSALRKCRHCMATMDDMKSKVITVVHVCSVGCQLSTSTYYQPLADQLSPRGNYRSIRKSTKVNCSLLFSYPCVVVVLS